MKVGIIGLGLMGGSFALDLKTPFPKWIIYGCDQFKENEKKAFELGIIDPAKVTRCALQNAASVAGILITTDHAIIEAD